MIALMSSLLRMVASIAIAASPDFTVEESRFVGDCRDSASARIAGTKLRLRLPSFSIELTDAERRKGCQAVVKLHYPSGWQFSVDKLETESTIELAAGASADFTFKWYFQGETDTAVGNKRWSGKKGGGGKVTMPFTDRWSPCEANRALNLGAFLTREGSGKVSSGPELDLSLKWRKCR